ncbi:non-ribosomal peptide synthetase [Vibrio nigripulchritudo]|uniref:non-ribosomal peptide synthetase n=1 Tax=Vibrio nigripulchritudo TaxID=28173 RepID=UPI0005FA786D|nr:non-ribosomal peptide synthetase [Vibrio nigripulchritudo]KJY80776.1 hypothetical protein TW74_00280 [Vibrio nigripulchritudo]
MITINNKKQKDLTHSIVRQFNYLASQTPESIAIEDNAEILTYKQVDVLSDRVAHCLVEQNNGSAPIHVGVVTDRSYRMIIAMLGVLKAGAVYVPIDPKHPTERQRYIFENARCSILLTDNIAPHFSPERTFHIDSLLEASAIKPLSHVPTHFDTACILYTSGTTGKPKGAMLTSKGIMNTCEALSETMGISPNSVMLHYASLGFDSATLEWLMALTNGAKLSIIPEEQRTDPEALSSYLVEKQITHAILPSAMLPYLKSDREYVLESLAAVGDVSDEKLLWHWSTKCNVFNGYGPMEMSICTSIHQVENGQPVNLGQPIQHTQVMVMDEQGCQANEGESGELWVTGVGLSLGYVNNPEQTELAFVTDKNGRTWYKTGDLVKQDGMGNLHFNGRYDHQVKIRGNRVELEEIEQTLKTLNTIDDACLITPTHSDGSKYLVAFYRGTGDEKSVRNSLTQMLPESHVPSSFIKLGSLPLTTNLKVDRRALHELYVSDYADKAKTLKTDSVNNRETIAALFLSELAVSTLSERESFFQLGGDSIGSIRLINKLNQTFSCAISMRQFRENPSVSGVLNLIQENETTANDGSESKALSISKHRPDTFELSSQQLVAWYMAQQQPDSKAYLAEAAIHFDGELDVLALEAALNDVYARHDIYRTIFIEEEGEPRQRVLPEIQYKLRVVEADSQNKAEVINRVLAEHLPGISDLSQLPLAEFVLIRFAGNDHVLMHQEHHIIHDGWSGSEFTREMMDAYRARFSSTSWQPEPVAQYYDFHTAQQGWLESNEAEKQQEYWCEKLENCPQGVPLFGKQSHALGFSGGHQKMVFSQKEWQAMEALCGAQGITPFAFTSAVLYLSMWRYSGQSDLTFGSAFANRNWQNSHGVLGMLVNTLVLRQSLDSTSTLSELLEQTQQTIDEAQDNQELPFTKVVEALNPDRSAVSNPFFNVLLGFHDTPIDVAPIEGLNWHKDETMISETSKFDLDCLVVPRGKSFNKDGEVHFLWEYRSDVYSAEEIALFLESFQYLFLDLVKRFDTVSNQTIDHLTAITPRQQALMNQQWGTGPQLSNAVQAKYGKLSLVAAIERAAQQNPDSTALAYGSHSYTYAQLELASNQLAIELDKAGVQPGERIGIVASRSPELIVAMYATFKFGACAVVIEPSLPPQRQAFILQDADISVVLGSISESKASVTSIPIESAFTHQETSRVWKTPRFEHDLSAYILYTSGSTGVPKGVDVSMSSLHNECCWHIDEFNLTPESTGTCLAFAGFDAFMAEVFPLLMAGGQVLILDDQERDDLSVLSQKLSEAQVTHSCLPTGLLEAVCASEFTWSDSLQTLLVGGDALGQVTFPQGFNANFYNLYGPTETTVDATFAKLVPQVAGQASDPQTPTIGRPIANAYACVVSQAGTAESTPTPIGVPGELVMGGKGITNGYLNQPELTQERFVQGHIVPDSVDTRWYRTGDQVRWSPSGELEYLGRLNDEVKVRGFRVSLGEITAHLQDHDEVSQAAVIVRQGAIYAYVTLVESEVAQWQSNTTKYERQLARKIRVSLKKSLPEYMRPSATLILESLPLTEQGKLDKRKLPSPFEEDSTFEAASSEMENAMLSIWSECLELPKISVTDNFFSIGGHSLLAMRIIARLRMEFSVELKMSDFFEFGTIRELSGYIESILAVQTDDVLDDMDVMEEGEI